MRARDEFRAATWLPEGTALGPVRLGSRLLDTKGTWINDSFSRSLLPVSSPVQPGETASFVAKIEAPSRGDYVIEFDMVAEGVAWFSRNGSVTVKIPFSVV